MDRLGHNVPDRPRKKKSKLCQSPKLVQLWASRRLFGMAGSAKYASNLAHCQGEKDYIRHAQQKEAVSSCISLSLSPSLSGGRKFSSKLSAFSSGFGQSQSKSQIFTHSTCRYNFNSRSRHQILGVSWCILVSCRSATSGSLS